MVTQQLQVEHRTGKVRQPKTDVLPLCHATNTNNNTDNNTYPKQLDIDKRPHSRATPRGGEWIRPILIESNAWFLGPT